MQTHLARSNTDRCSVVPFLTAIAHTRADWLRARQRANRVLVGACKVLARSMNACTRAEHVVPTTNLEQRHKTKTNIVWGG
jgi:hypothetical protein